MILLDTHILIWMAIAPEKLSPRAHRVILEARRATGLAISAMTLWELAWVAQRGRIQISSSVADFVRECCSTVIVRPITVEIALRAVQLPTAFPNDPQDRLIGATAIVEGLPLVTADERIQNSRVIDTIW